MNKLILLFLVIVLAVDANAQTKEDATAVNWETPEMYTTKSISVKTDFVEFVCNDCKYVEIKTSAGITGIFITGKGSYTIPGRSITDKFYGCMVRFNPGDLETLVKIEAAKRYSDEQQLHASLVELRTVFKHCYHSGWDALIPEKGAYTINFLGGKFKDLLAFDTRDKKGVYDFSEKKEL